MNWIVYFFHLILDITPKDVENAYKILEYYIDSVDNINLDHKQGMFDMYTDSGFLYGTYRTINYLIEKDVTVYQYILTYEGEYSFSQLFYVPPNGVCHADDLLYLWNPSFLGPLSGDDLVVRDVMSSAWTNFAIYGDPTPPGSYLSWTPVDPKSELQNYWNISGTNPTMATSHEIHNRMMLWDQIMKR